MPEKTPLFNGFSDQPERLIPLPGTFFHELLPLLHDVNEIKLILYTFWRMEHMEGSFRYLRHLDYLDDPAFLTGLDEDPARALEALNAALHAAVEHGVLLQAEQGQNAVYFLNSPRGRAAIQAIQRGEWRPLAPGSLPPEMLAERPNIYQIYEQDFGPLTPMIADALRDAEQTYPAAWIEEAMRMAVERNKRNWRYTAAILKRWQEEGRDERKNRQDTEKDRRRYIEGEFADFIEH